MSPSPPRRSKGKSVTLADHLGNERLRDKEEPRHVHRQNLKPTTTTTSRFSRLKKQKSCKEFNNNFENNTFTARSSFSDNSVVKKASSCNHHIVPRRLSFDDNTFSSCNNNSWMVKKLTMQRANSPTTFTGYMTSKSQWALSPGRSGSPPMSVESNDRTPFSFSSFRPQNNKTLTMGFHLFTSNNKSLTSTTSSLAVHHLRMLNNRLLQWRFTNCKAETLNVRMSAQTERNIIHALDGLTKLRSSVSQKKIQLERERLEMKLNSLLHSQMKLLVEGWGEMEREHLAALGVMKECLHSIVCKVPLLQGAKAGIQSASIAQRHASDLIVSINSILSTFSPSQAYKAVELLSELAKVVVQEKLLLEDINNLFRSICILELKERSLKCCLIQLQC